nr:hypothetical protein [Delftia sp. CH05]
MAAELDTYTAFDPGNWPCHKAADMLRGLQTENASMRTTLEYVERWANHHGTKPHITAEQALGCIQHHPDIHDITRGYADCKRPDTFDPYARIAELEASKNARIHELEMQALDLASENSILKLRDADELEARKPLPPARVEQIMDDAGISVPVTRTAFAGGLRHGELVHGITGGSS